MMLRAKAGKPGNTAVVTSNASDASDLKKFFFENDLLKTYVKIRLNFYVILSVDVVRRELFYN